MNSPETFRSPEPINPRTHMELIRRSTSFVQMLTRYDLAKGDDVPYLDVLLEPGNMHGPRKRVSEVLPIIPKGWNGKFFKLPEGADSMSLVITAPTTQEDPVQEIVFSATFSGKGMLDQIPDDPTAETRLLIPFKRAVIPIGERAPDRAENDGYKPHDGAEVPRPSLSELEAQDLLADIADLTSLQPTPPNQPPTSTS